jgi:hypothetical protein
MQRRKQHSRLTTSAEGLQQGFTTITQQMAHMYTKPLLIKSVYNGLIHVTSLPPHQLCKVDQDLQRAGVKHARLRVSKAPARHRSRST